MRTWWCSSLLGLLACNIYEPQPPGDDDVTPGPAIARDDSIAMAEDSDLQVLDEQLLANDSRVTTLRVVGEASHGVAGVDWNGQLGYTPYPGYHGTDSFTYEVNGGDQATVTIDIASDGIPYEEGVLIDTGAMSSAIAAGDLSGDGVVDLAVVDADTSSVAVLVNRSTGPLGFAFETTQFESGRYPLAVGLADLDDDGDDDLVTAAGNDGQLVVLPGAGGQVGFAEPLYLPAGVPIDLVVVDLNGDGRLDLASLDWTAASWNLPGDDLIVYLNDGAAPGELSFAGPWRFDVPSGPRGLAAGDLDDDGRTDLVVVSETAASMAIFVNATGIGDLVPAFAARVDRPTGNQPADVTIADLDGDGRDEIAIAHRGDPTVWLFGNATEAVGNPVFQAARVLPGTRSVVAAAVDVDASGTPDLVVGRVDQDSLGVLFNRTEVAGAFALESAQLGAIGVQGFQFWSPDLADPTGIAFVDLDGAGRPELVVTLAGVYGTSGTLILFER